MAHHCVDFCMLPSVFGPHSCIPGQHGGPASPSQYSRLLYISVEDQPIFVLRDLGGSQTAPNLQRTSIKCLE